MFARAASASARSALVKHARGPEAAQEAEARPASQYSSGPIICERIIEDKNDVGAHNTIADYSINMWVLI